MYKIIFVLVLVSVFYKTDAQKKRVDFNLYNKDWIIVRDIDSATYFMTKTFENDTTFICRFYNRYGPMIQMESYKDSSATVLNGIIAWYDLKGNLDSVGNYCNNKRNGLWRYSFNNGIAKIVNKYNDGVLIESNVSVKSTQGRGIKSAEFKNGGMSGWSSYLQKNINTPERFKRISDEEIKSVLIEFEIDSRGSIRNVIVIHSSEWSIDSESVRVVMNSPAWIPATESGISIGFINLQNFTYKLAN